MNEDIQGLEIYVLDSFDTLAAVICKSVTGSCWEVEWWFVKIVNGEVKI